jgi:hypothetical protein
MLTLLETKQALDALRAQTEPDIFAQAITPPRPSEIGALAVAIVQQFSGSSKEDAIVFIHACMAAAAATCAAISKPDTNSCVGFMQLASETFIEELCKAFATKMSNLPVETQVVNLREHGHLSQAELDAVREKLQ